VHEVRERREPWRWWAVRVGRDGRPRWTCVMDLRMFATLWGLLLVVVTVSTVASLLWYLCATESTRGWIQTSCSVKKRVFDTRCVVVEKPCPATDVEARLIFVVETTQTKRMGMGEVNAYWGPGPDTYTPNLIFARSRLRLFMTLQNYTCWYKPEEPTRVSMVRYAWSTRYRTNINRDLILLGVLTAFILLTFLIRAAVQRQEEQEAADRKLQLTLERHQKTSIPRWLMKRLSNSCRVLRSDIVSEVPPDCGICIDELFIEFDLRRTLRIPCDHLFHEDCLAQQVILGGQKSCPICKYDLHMCPKVPLHRRTSILEDQPCSFRSCVAPGSPSSRSLAGGYSASEEATDSDASLNDKRSRIHRSPWR